MMDFSIILNASDHFTIQETKLGWDGIFTTDIQIPPEVWCCRYVLRV